LTSSDDPSAEGTGRADSPELSYEGKGKAD
jgi:hypothetical protein